MTVIRRSVADAVIAKAARDAAKIDQSIHELNNSPGERVFVEGAKQNGAKPGAGTYYRGLGGFDTTLLVKR